MAHPNRWPKTNLKHLPVLASSRPTTASKPLPQSNTIGPNATEHYPNGLFNKQQCELISNIHIYIVSHHLEVAVVVAKSEVWTNYQL
jgi:hypothetical protein